MPKQCAVCAHPDRVAIDSDPTTASHVSIQYGLSIQSIRRHRVNHLPDSAKSKATLNATIELTHVRELLERADRERVDLISQRDHWQRQAAEAHVLLQQAQERIPRLSGPADAGTGATNKRGEHSEPVANQPRLRWLPWRRPATVDAH